MPAYVNQSIFREKADQSVLLKNNLDKSSISEEPPSPVYDTPYH